MKTAAQINGPLVGQSEALPSRPAEVLNPSQLSEEDKNRIFYALHYRADNDKRLIPQDITKLRLLANRICKGETK